MALRESNVLVVENVLNEWGQEWTKYYVAHASP